jgi:hypothetical protein
MLKIILYIGRNVSKLQFIPGFFSLEKPYGIHGNNIFIDPTATSLKLPENNFHPTDISLNLLETISLFDNEVGIYISTNSKIIIDTLSQMIRQDAIEGENIVINVLDEDNRLLTISGFDSEGYLTNWPSGCLSADFDLVDEKIKEFKTKLEKNMINI